MNSYVKKVIEGLDNKSGKTISLLLDGNILYKNEFTNELINSDNPFYVFNAAKYIKGLDLKVLTEAIIRTNNLDYIYKFARDIKEADINKLFDAIVKTNNYEYIFYFTLLVGKEKFKEIETIIIRDAFYLQLFYELINNPSFIKYRNNKEEVMKKVLTK